MTTEVWRTRNHYDLLEVDRTASPAELHAAFILQQLAWHPDRFSDAAMKAAATERIQAINRAHDVLRDPARRARYNLSLPPEDVENDQFELSIQGVGATWKRMAAWMKDEDVGSPTLRSVAFNTGDHLERRRQISDKMLPLSKKAWAAAVDAGFDPEADDDE